MMNKMPPDKPTPSFSIDTVMVKHVAFLVRLGIEEDEAQAFSRQFSSIIDYFHLLNEVDTQNVPPACDTSNVRNILRADEVHPSMPREDFFRNVPHRDGDYVKVPQIFDED
jgi:aspartyl-tRNA(Asn)/glutamyl-tRNA(Gln) amidotransferase subunit C